MEAGGFFKYRNLGIFWADSQIPGRKISILGFPESPSPPTVDINEKLKEVYIRAQWYSGKVVKGLLYTQS